MMTLVLLISIAAVVGVGCLIWKFLLRQNVVRLPNPPTRRREDARDWQRRFGAASALAANFLQPTQNEILETLYVLDHLTPGWEAGDDGLAERHFLNELALNFPTLRKEDCAFPLPFGETPISGSELRDAGAHGFEAASTEERFAVRREKFRATRAQINALEQIISGPVGDEEIPADGLPSHPREIDSGIPERHRWPALFAGAAMLLAAAVGIVHFFPRTLGLESVTRWVEHVLARPSVVVAAPPVEAEPLPELPPVAPAVAAAPSTPAPVPVVAILPETIPAPPSSSTSAGEKAALDQQIAASKQRAISKYPALAVEGSEINLRFVFRYRNLLQENSPRLRNPSWPEQLVEECAKAAGTAPKRNAFTQVLGTQH